ncbi:MAG: UbiA family prenyltransferase, partial [Candidatus Thermoplasmatota archaeon]|nr:UbiA family prenyltransferase [Candidatus Thermoplasmatota archaeon]
LVFLLIKDGLGGGLSREERIESILLWRVLTCGIICLIYIQVNSVPQPMRSAHIYAIALLAIPLALTICASLTAFLLFIITNMLGFGYTVIFKRRGIKGSLIFGSACLALFLTAMVTTSDFLSGNNTVMIFYSSRSTVLLAFLCCGLFVTQTAENIAGTIRDTKSDNKAHIKTAATLLGHRYAGILAITLTIIGFLLFLIAIGMSPTRGSWVFFVFGLGNLIVYIDGTVFISLRTNRGWMGITFLYEVGLYIGLAFAIAL